MVTSEYGATPCHMKWKYVPVDVSLLVSFSYVMPLALEWFTGLLLEVLSVLVKWTNTL